MEDSYKNWFQVRYQYDEAETFEKALEIQREVDLAVLEWGMSLQEDELWHVHYGFKKDQNWFSIRVKPSKGKMKERKNQAQKLGEEISATPVTDNKTWWTSDDSFPGECKTIAEWEAMAHILHDLSKIVYELVKMDTGRGEFFLYHVVVHHLHNMMHIQDEFYPVPVEHNLSKRCLLMSGRLLTIDKITTQWFPPKVR